MWHHGGSLLVNVEEQPMASSSQGSSKRKHLVIEDLPVTGTIYVSFADIRNAVEAASALRGRNLCTPLTHQSEIVQTILDWMRAMGDRLNHHDRASIRTFKRDVDVEIWKGSLTPKSEGQLLVRAKFSGPAIYFNTDTVGRLILDLLSNYGSVMAYEALQTRKFGTHQSHVSITVGESIRSDRGSGQRGQEVSLKIISRKKLISRDMAGRVEREIQYLQLLRHTHIIKLYTVITTGTDIVIVLKYARGELFDYLVKYGKMAEPKARRFFQQIVFHGELHPNPFATSPVVAPMNSMDHGRIDPSMPSAFPGGPLPNPPFIFPMQPERAAREDASWHDPSEKLPKIRTNIAPFAIRSCMTSRTSQAQQGPASPEEVSELSSLAGAVREETGALATGA
ncbi:MAG: hypothetical protein Q9226_001362 [Calogaya cf. arnoldii]